MSEKRKTYRYVLGQTTVVSFFYYFAIKEKKISLEKSRLGIINKGEKKTMEKT